MPNNPYPPILFASDGFKFDDWKSIFDQIGSDRELTLKANPDTQYAVLWKHPHGCLKGLENLKIIFSLGAGVDHILDDPELPDVPIVRAVSNNLTHRMSEYVVWQVLDHHRQGSAYRHAQSQKIWSDLGYQPAASEVKVGILGLGELGLDAALKLKQIGFDVSGWSRSPKQLDGVTCYCGDDGLDEFLKQQDILVVLLPHTSHTEGMLNDAFFNRLKRDSAFGKPVLINAGRGALQNEADILTALDDGRLSAVTLDVFEKEPLESDSPLWEHPKVTVTPHIAADSDPQSIMADILDQISNFEAGGALRNLVDRARGY